jgi:hypothetical protein
MLSLPAPARGHVPTVEPLIEPEDYRKSDARMFDTALKGHWPLSEDIRARVVETLVRVIAHPYSDARAIVGASRTLIEADKVNHDVLAAAPVQPKRVTQPDGRSRLDFSDMTDDELQTYLDTVNT